MAWFSNPRVSNMKNFLSMKLLIQSLQKIYKYWNQLSCFKNGCVLFTILWWCHEPYNQAKWNIWFNFVSSLTKQYLHKRIQIEIWNMPRTLALEITQAQVRWSFDHLRLIWLSLNKKSKIQNDFSLTLDEPSLPSDGV